MSKSTRPARPPRTLVVLCCVSAALSGGCSAIGFGVGWAAEPDRRLLGRHELDRSVGSEVDLELTFHDRETSDVEGKLTKVEWPRRDGPSAPTRICVEHEQGRWVSRDVGFEATEDCVTGFSAVHAPEGTAGKWIGLGVGAAVDVLTFALLAAMGPSFGPR